MNIIQWVIIVSVVPMPRKRNLIQPVFKYFSKASAAIQAYSTTCLSDSSELGQDCYF